MQALFCDFRTLETGLQHGTLTVLCQGQPVEVTSFRSDGEYLDGRRPASVSFTPSLEEDVARRDFTVNALCLDEGGEVLDLVGGLQDLEHRCLRAVGDADRRFSEDALRIWRAVRFPAQLGFSV